MTLENSQCILRVKDTQIVPSEPNDLIINWSITMKPTQLLKLQCERLYAKDNENLNSAWKVKGYIREQ